jgi:hypothetical protein
MKYSDVNVQQMVSLVSWYMLDHVTACSIVRKGDYSNLISLITWTDLY